MRTDDAALARLSRQGDRQAFEALVIRHQTSVYRLALRMLRSPQDAEDAAQEAFLRAYLALPGFRGDAAFKTWLYRIASNVCLDRLRRGSQEIPDERSATAARDAPGAAGANPLGRLLRREERRDLAGALQALPPHYRVAIVLHYVQGLSYREIAEVLEIAPRTVETRLYRAKALLRARLAETVAAGGGGVDG